MADLAPVPTPEDPTSTSTCSSCGAPLVADQRYCLSCGQPCSPTRLAFLDVLDSERRAQAQLGAGPAGAAGTMPAAVYSAYVEPAGPLWLRRYAPIFGVASVLLLALLAGLLLGHWAGQGTSAAASGPQIIKVEGLSAGAPAATSTGTTTAPAPTSTGSSAASSSAAKSAGATSAKKEEEKEQAEAKAEERAEATAPAKAPPAKPLDSKSATKLEHSTGKTKEAELNKITTAPIEVK